VPGLGAWTLRCSRRAASVGRRECVPGRNTRPWKGVERAGTTAALRWHRGDIMCSAGDILEFGPAEFDRRGVVRLDHESVLDLTDAEKVRSSPNFI
jgi:hypothetical protein